MPSYDPNVKDLSRNISHVNSFARIIFGKICAYLGEIFFDLPIAVFYRGPVVPSITFKISRYRKLREKFAGDARYQLV